MKYLNYLGCWQNKFQDIVAVIDNFTILLIVQTQAKIKAFRERE